jgi:DNA-binding transcriptional LysR family regulator
MVIQATLKHLGVGLVADFLCQDFIEKQQLINPLDIKIASNYGYYLIIPPHKRDQKKVISFTHWIKEQLQ